jgi:hypothetical protein
MSFRYASGDVVVVAPYDLWWLRGRRGKQKPLQAVVTDRKSKPEKQNFPLYRLQFAKPPREDPEPWISEHAILGLAREFKAPTHAYYTVITHEPLFFLRVPIRGLRWRDMLKGLTPVLRSHDIKTRDVQIEGRDGTEDAHEADLVRRLEKAFAGDATAVRSFGLLDWQGGAAVVIREPGRV